MQSSARAPSESDNNIRTRIGSISKVLYLQEIMDLSGVPVEFTGLRSGGLVGVTVVLPRSSAGCLFVAGSHSTKSPTSSTMIDDELYGYHISRILRSRCLGFQTKTRKDLWSTHPRNRLHTMLNMTTTTVMITSDFQRTAVEPYEQFARAFTCIGSFDMLAVRLTQIVYDLVILEP